MIQVTVFYEAGAEIHRLDHYRDFGTGKCGKRGRRELLSALDSMWGRAMQFGSPVRSWNGCGFLGLRKNHRPLLVLVREGQEMMRGVWWSDR